MKKILLYFFAVVCCCIFAGCSGPKVMVAGIEYDALTDEEINQLCSLAELYLRNNVPNVISVQESRQLNRCMPVCTVQYNGDRSGHAVVRWELPQRNIEVVFDGQLLKPSAKCWVQTEERSPEVIDFTKKGTLQKQLQTLNPEKQQRPKRSKKSKRR